MATGTLGQLGLPAASHVTMAPSPEQEPAPTLLPRTTGRIVLVVTEKHRTVTLKNVQVDKRLFVLTLFMYLCLLSFPSCLVTCCLAGWVELDNWLITPLYGSNFSCFYLVCLPIVSLVTYSFVGYAFHSFFPRFYLCEKSCVSFSPFLVFVIYLFIDGVLAFFYIRLFKYSSQ